MAIYNVSKVTCNEYKNAGVTNYSHTHCAVYLSLAAYHYSCVSLQLCVLHIQVMRLYEVQAYNAVRFPGM